MKDRSARRFAASAAALTALAVAWRSEAQTPAAVAPRAAPPAAAAAAARAGGERPLEQAPKRLPGYLGAAPVVDGYAVLPPPPTPGSREPAELLDRAAFEAMQKTRGSDRWRLATRDADESAAAVLADFDCAFGLDLSPEAAPALLRLLTRVRTDAGVQTTSTKRRFQHWRPFVSYGGAICTPEIAEGTAHTWSYPSGHTFVGWAYGLILAELAPDLATPIFQRARAYGESRVVCGVHTVSDVEAGRVNASMIVAALHANVEFRADLEAARVELAALRVREGAAPDERQCPVEREAMAHTPWLAVKDPARAAADPPRTLPAPLPPLKRR